MGTRTQIHFLLFPPARRPSLMRLPFSRQLLKSHPNTRRFDGSRALRLLVRVRASRPHQDHEPLLSPS